MFYGTPDPLPPVLTLSDFGQQDQVQTGSTNHLATETDIDAIPVVVQTKHRYSHCDCVDICFRC